MQPSFDSPGAWFLQSLRDLTTKYRAVLIFDEVITGLRLAAGGGAEYFGVSPDLAVFAKALAGGYPLSAVAGSEALLSPIETAKVLHFGTFNGNPIALAAADATLEILLDPLEDVYSRMNRLGKRLFQGLQTLPSQGLPILVQGVPTCFHILFTEQRAITNYSDFVAYDITRTRLWVETALLESIFQMGDARWYVSAAHTDEDITATLEKAKRALARLASTAELFQKTG